MPFTLSHPAAVLVAAPLLGRLAVPSALAIGAMAPDFPYFAAAPIPRNMTHTLASILWFSLPVGWIAYLVFERVLRAPLVQLLPSVLRWRLAQRVPLAPPFAVSVSLLVGAATHVAWDAFTHGGWLLSYELLQHGSTAIGAGLLAIYTLSWIQRTEEISVSPKDAVGDVERLVGRIAIVLIPPAAGLGVAFAWAPPVEVWKSLGWFAAQVTVSGISTAVVLLSLGGLWRHSE